MLLLGLPMHLLIVRKLKPHWLIYGLFGAIAGFVSTLVFIIVIINSDITLDLFRFVAKLGVPIGAMSSVAFYLILRPRRPPPNAPTL